MQEKQKNKLEAQNALVKREEQIANATAQSLVAVKDDFFGIILKQEKLNMTAGRKGSWLLACRMVREKLSVDESIAQLRKELVKLQREEEKKGRFFDRPLTSQIENYRALLAHALHLRNKQVTKGAFNEADDTFPARAKWYPVRTYKAIFEMEGVTATEAVGKWDYLSDAYQKKVIAPVVRDAEKDGTPKSAILPSTYDKQLKRLAKAAKGESGGGNATAMTPEDVAIGLLKRDETRLALISRCGPDLLKQIEVTIAQVRASMIDAAKRSN